jgi:hypothetical protein
MFSSDGPVRQRHPILLLPARPASEEHGGRRSKLHPQKGDSGKSKTVGWKNVFDDPGKDSLRSIVFKE